MRHESQMAAKAHTHTCIRMYVCRSVRKCIDSVGYEQIVLFLLLTGVRTIKLCWQQLLLLLLLST